MKVCIIGASGKLGKYMVQQALDRGYEVVGVCRERSLHKLDEFKTRITIIPGATNDRDVIRKAVAGCDGVLTVLVPWGSQHYSTGTAQAVLDYASPGARLIFSCGWHISMDGQDVYPASLRRDEKIARWVGRLTRLIDIHDFKFGIIFCNTKRMVDDLVDHLEAQGYSADRLHGDMSQQMRDRVMNKFRKSGLEFLVATDIAARGIDVDGISHVVNYDFPMHSEDYVHRIGRTGRAHAVGDAISFVTPEDRDELRRLERFIGRGIVQLRSSGSAEGPIAFRCRPGWCRARPGSCTCAIRRHSCCSTAAAKRFSASRLSSFQARVLCGTSWIFE